MRRKLNTPPNLPVGEAANRSSDGREEDTSDPTMSTCYIDLHGESEELFRPKDNTVPIDKST